MIINIKTQNKNYEKIFDEIININLIFDKKLKIDKNKNIDNNNIQIDINNNDKKIITFENSVNKKYNEIKTQKLISSFNKDINNNEQNKNPNNKNNICLTQNNTNKNIYLISSIKKFLYL